MFKKAFKEILAYLFAAIIVWICITIIKEENYIQNYIVEAINRCLNVIIPSLFIFMALSGIIISSRIYTYISKPFYPVARFLFSIPDELFFVFLLGNVFGYPVGAKLLIQLVKEQKISRKSAEIMSCFCFGGGPAFLTGTIGIVVFNNEKIGVIIFASSIIANSVLAIILCRLNKIEYISGNSLPNLSTDIIVNSVISAGKAMFIICITIIFCSAIMGIINSYGIFEYFSLSFNASVILKSLLEVSVLSQLTNHPYTLLPFISAMCSFGGLCVLAQVKVIVNGAYSLNKFFISRIVSAVLSYGVCSIILKLIRPEVIETLSPSIKVISQPNNIVPSICLIAMILILCMHKKAVRN